MKVICDYNSCTGCSACANICPKSCITMNPDQDGFLHPNIDIKNCINCKLCFKTCPINNQYVDDKKKPFAIAAMNKDLKIRLASSSGGIFSVLAEYVIDNDGVVFGASFDKSFNVEHIACANKEELRNLRGSKYLQSNINGTYKYAKEVLDSGKFVLFSGTACQIAGLKSYLGKEYEKLYTNDIICHGVPSPKVWQKYKVFQSMGIDSEIETINFRSKIDSWKKYSIRFLYKNGLEYTEIINNNKYMRCFLMDLCLRPSCYECRFKQIHRQADITLADFWGVESILPLMNDDKGTSLVLIHSKKGRELMEKILYKIDSSVVDFDESIKQNPSMMQSATKPPLRGRFMRDLDRFDFEKVYLKYCSSNFLSRLRRKLSKIFNF